jgi:hypothetical protein
MYDILITIQQDGSYSIFDISGCVDALTINSKS